MFRQNRLGGTAGEESVRGGPPRSGSTAGGDHGGNNQVYYSYKRVYALQQLHKSGLISKLLSLESAKTVIIFGSIIRGDGYKDSDIDIFILGNLPEFDKKLYGGHFDFAMPNPYQTVNALRHGYRVFGKMAETVAQYLKKGSAVLVEGRLTPDKTSGGPRVYQRPDGTMGATYEVAANTVRFLSGRGESGPGSAPAPSEEDIPVVSEDEIPF